MGKLLELEISDRSVLYVPIIIVIALAHVFVRIKDYLPQDSDLVLLTEQSHTQSPLVSCWSPGETLGNWNFITTGFYGKTMQVVMRQPIKRLTFLEFPRVSPGNNQPLAKEPEDCGYKID